MTRPVFDQMEGDEMRSPMVAKALLWIAVIVNFIPLTYALISRDPVTVSPLIGGVDSWTSLITLATALILYGLFISRGRPAVGGTLVVLGSILMGMEMLWLAPTWPGILFVAWVGVVRARGFARGKQMAA